MNKFLIVGIILFFAGCSEIPISKPILDSGIEAVTQTQKTIPVSDQAKVEKYSIYIERAEQYYDAGKPRSAKMYLDHAAEQYRIMTDATKRSAEVVALKVQYDVVYGQVY